jgi:hypothetical protein
MAELPGNANRPIAVLALDFAFVAAAFRRATLTLNSSPLEIALRGRPKNEAISEVPGQKNRPT